MPPAANPGNRKSIFRLSRAWRSSALEKRCGQKDFRSFGRAPALSEASANDYTQAARQNRPGRKPPGIRPSARLKPPYWPASPVHAHLSPNLYARTVAFCPIFATVICGHIRQRKIRQSGADWRPERPLGGKGPSSRQSGCSRPEAELRENSHPSAIVYFRNAFVYPFWPSATSSSVLAFGWIVGSPTRDRTLETQIDTRSSRNARKSLQTNGRDLAKSIHIHLRFSFPARLSNGAIERRGKLSVTASRDAPHSRQG